ncbi:unnamed protein product [Hydatigera taeniaeformis]|uniref:Transmembrane protein n=1 Tax=Hydatigena taeniaeformis TaxID=6205 RepID=A0A0R3X957_HYDTA|nr:unnamed protein product [Hydatigera taeniaeformis]
MHATLLGQAGVLQTEFKDTLLKDAFAGYEQWRILTRVSRSEVEQSLFQLPAQWANVARSTITGAVGLTMLLAFDLIHGYCQSRDYTTTREDSSMQWICHFDSTLPPPLVCPHKIQQRLSYEADGKEEENAPPCLAANGES